MTGTTDRESLAAFLLRQRARPGIDPAVLSAIEATPRASYLAGHLWAAAWEDGMLPIECGEAIESPDLQALALSRLAVEPGCRVLEIGTGTGFTAAVMGRVAGRVVSVDRYRTLTDLARQRLEQAGQSNVVVRQADGSAGLPAEGPFDRIVVWASFPDMPRGFLDQLSSNGVMVVPIGPDEGRQAFTRLLKIGSRFERDDFASVRLQPLVKGAAARL